MNPHPVVKNIGVHASVDGADVHFLFRENEDGSLALYGAHPGLPLATADSLPGDLLENLREQVLEAFRRLLPLTVSQ